METLATLMSTEETLLNLDFDKTAITAPDDGVVSLSSSAEDICLVPEVGFEGNLDSPGVNRESQPLLGGRGDLEVSFNHFPGINFETIDLLTTAMSPYLIMAIRFLLIVRLVIDTNNLILIF